MGKRPHRQGHPGWRQDGALTRPGTGVPDTHDEHPCRRENDPGDGGIGYSQFDCVIPRMTTGDGNGPSPQRSGRPAMDGIAVARICIIRQGYLPYDSRVRSEVEALIERGHEVDVLCLRYRDEPLHERRGRLRIRRIPIPMSRGGWSRYLLQYGAFMLIAAFLVSLHHLRRRYDLVQVNTLPDSLVFSAVVPRLLGARVLLDLHECLPEFVSTKFAVGLDHRLVRLVARVEQASIRFADFAITCTEPMRRAFISRGATKDDIAVILGSFGLRLGAGPVPPRTAARSPGFTLICHGTIEERYGLDTLVRAVALLEHEIPSLRLQIYGDGSYRAAVQALVRDLGLEPRVSFSNGWVSAEELLQALQAADAGVVAIKQDAFRDLTLCNKMFDFIGLRKPAMVSRTRSVEEYFDDTCFQMFTADDPQDLARAIRDLYGDPELRRRLVDRAAQVAAAYSWARQREHYLQIVDGLVQAGPLPATRRAGRRRLPARESLR